MPYTAVIKKMSTPATVSFPSTSCSSSHSYQYYYFYQYHEATVAAINYVINRYGDEKWFAGHLRKLILDLHFKPSKECFVKPLVIIQHSVRNNDDNDIVDMDYKGFHYLIDQMEQCYQSKVLTGLEFGILRYVQLLNTLICLIYLAVMCYYLLLQKKKKNKKEEVMDGDWGGG